MSEPVRLVALSGGKDSTALALRLAELHTGYDFTYFCTPTGDELPGMGEHWAALECRLGKPLDRITAQTLNGLIEHFGALPNWRQRWCTRMLKIQPCLALIHRLQSEGKRVVLYVGLRADEEARKGIYGEELDVRFPMRDWGWALADVRRYLADQGVSIPRRTDCARCYDQQIVEWWRLWRDHRDIWDHASGQEQRYGHTFRSPARDTWPTPLADLGPHFEAGHVPRGGHETLSLFGEEHEACRVCRL